MNIVRDRQDYIAPMDTTVILPTVPKFFDPEYLPETKVEQDPIDTGTVFTLMESLGSTLGEITFPAPVKQEPRETEKC